MVFDFDTESNPDHCMRAFGVCTVSISSQNELFNVMNSAGISISQILV